MSRRKKKQAEEQTYYQVNPYAPPANNVTQQYSYEQSPSPYSRNSGNYASAKKRMSKAKKISIVIVAVLIMAFVCAGTAMALYYNHVNHTLTHGGKSNDEIEKINKALETPTPVKYDDTFYMLLLGSDTREKTVKGFGRSDSNIVARVDPKHHKVTLLSIPRDTKIQIPGHGTQKFNAAYAFNGVAGAIEATEELLDIDISHYAEVSFKDLADLVDAVGGITVYNESRINNYKCDDGDGNHYIIEKGEQTLNGGQALTFARNRDYPDGDFTRQKHQRQVVEAISEKVLEAPITAMPKIIESAIKCVTTDLSLSDIIDLAKQFMQSDGEEEVIIYSCMLPSFTKTINGISFVICDEEKTEEMLKVFKRGGDPGDYKSTKTAADYVDESEETKDVLLYDDDDSVVSGSATSYRSESSYTYTPPASNQGGYNDGVDGGSSTDSSGSSGNVSSEDESGSGTGEGASGSTGDSSGDDVVESNE